MFTHLTQTGSEWLERLSKLRADSLIKLILLENVWRAAAYIQINEEHAIVLVLSVSSQDVCLTF